MNRMEIEFNKNRVDFPIVECYILDLVNGGGFGSSLNALSISDIVKNLPDGYELELLMTFENYFDHKIIDEYSIEIKNSQYLYYESFGKLVDGGFYEYIKAIQNGDEAKIVKMDRKYS